MAPAALTLRDLNRATLARQMLFSREKITIPRAIERLVAMQAQVARPPFVGLFARVAGFRREALAKLLVDREVVRATSLRGTIHVMTARDFAGLYGSLAPAIERGMKQILKARLDGLDVDAWVGRAARFFAEPRTFDAYRKLLAKEAEGLDVRAIAYAARCRLPLVQVPTKDAWCFPASADFTVAASWLGAKIDTKKDDPKELVRRYLAAFGPAGPADAQTWSGRDGLKAIFESMRDELVVLRDAKKKELFDLPSAPRPGADVDAPARLLPEFDNLVLSHADRARFVPPAHKKRVFLPALRVAATFLVDGFVAGTWRVDREKASATLVLSPFEKLAKAAAVALEEEASLTLSFVEPSAEKRRIEIERAR